MRNLFIFLEILFAFLVSLPGFSQSVITYNHTAEELTSMLGGAGVTILDSEILYTTPGYSLGQFHYHTGFSADLGMDSGIVLSTGIVVDSGMAPGIHNPAYRDANMNFVGAGTVSPDLLTYDTLLQKIFQSYDSTAYLSGEMEGIICLKDLCELELDFIAEGDSIYIRFVFAYEKLLSQICNVTPVAMGIVFYDRDTDGSGGMVNIAVVPGTDIPISSNSVNFAPEELPDTSTMRYCRRYGEGSPFSDFLIANDDGEEIVFNRYTEVLIGRAAVVPFRPYKMRIMIAHIYGATSSPYDGAVFLEAGSLTTISPGGLGIEEEQKATFFSVHPNPVRDRLAIYWRDPGDPGPVQAELLDITGRAVITAAGQRKAIQEQLNAQLHTMVPGSYFLRVTTERNTQVVKIQKW